MIKIHDKVFIGDINDCESMKLLEQPTATIHACKSPCHQRGVGYMKSLPTDHEFYLSKETWTLADLEKQVNKDDLVVQHRDLYLNIIDPPVPLFKIQTLHRFLEFGLRCTMREDREVLIHCNKGGSRAPMLGMLLLTVLRRKDLGPDWPYRLAWPTYDIALKEFCKIIDATPGAGFVPGKGIATFVREHWDEIFCADKGE